jgi:hypothetical protein
MAKLELRDTTIYLRDGLSGTGAVNEAALAGGETDIDVDTLVLNNTDDGTTVPVGARFTVVGETDTPEHTVTAVTGADPTTNIVFTPALASAVADDAVITFLPIQLEIKVGDGNLTYTENKEYTYELDRDQLDTVREGADQPVSVNVNFVYEFVKTGTSETTTVVDALKGVGGAAAWISSDQVDNCNPYAVDLVIVNAPACSGQSVEAETTLLADLRYDSLQFDLEAAQIALTGRCNVTEATVTRG